MRIPVPCTAIAAPGAVGLISGAYAQCPASGPGNLTQSPDAATIEVPNSIACGGGDTNGDGFTDTTQNGWSRAFSDANEGVGTPITITGVSYGVQLATETGIPLAINLYLDPDSTGGANTPGVDAVLVHSEATTVDTVAGIGGCGPEDIDGDGAVGVTDLTAVILAWGACPGGCAEDIDGNENVGVTDLTAVILAWGACPAEPTYLVTLPLSTGVTWPAGCDLWIEIEQVENGQTTGYSFRPGGNSVPDCGASYLRAAACGINNFEDLVNIGFPTANLILSASFDGGGVGNCPGVNPCGDPGAGDCCDANGTPGCDDAKCCDAVCAVDPFCCDAVWDGDCAGLVLTNCDPLICVDAAPCPIATGPTASDGYLSVSIDEMGGHGNWNAAYTDTYNPVGPEAASNPTFSAAQEFYIASTHRQVLTRLPEFTNLNDDDSIDLFIVTPDDGGCSANTSDTNADGVDDTKTTSFRIVAGDGSFDLLVDLVQSVTTAGGVAKLTQAYTFSDDGALGAVAFDLYAIGDYDHVWGAGDFADDNVGTTYNGSGNPSTYAYQMDPGQPETAINISILGSADYTCSKAGCDPDDAGPDPPYGFGSDTQEWDSYGLPESWKNHIAGVGTDVNGDSGPTPACAGPTADAHLGMQQSVSVPMGGSASVTIVRTYGSLTP